MTSARLTISLGWLQWPVLIDEGEEVVADGDEEVSSDKLFHVFHYLVPITELFAS